MKSKIFFMIVFVTFLFQSCYYRVNKAEEEVEKLQRKLDKIHYMAEEYVIDEDIDSAEYENIQRLLWDIEEESMYEEYEFYVPE